MQFIITAYDYQDKDAINRRVNQRAAHLAGISALVKQGIFLSGGAILNNQGKMIGSSVHMSFNSREDLETWLQQEPYVIGKVWEKIEVNDAHLFPVEDYR